MDILLSTVTNHDGVWKKTTKEDQYNLQDISQCQEIDMDHQTSDKKEVLIEHSDIEEEILDYGEPVNFTHHDYLKEIYDHAWHLHMPRSHMVEQFKILEHGEEINIDSFEQRIKKTKRPMDPAMESVLHVHTQSAVYVCTLSILVFLMFTLLVCLLHTLLLSQVRDSNTRNKVKMSKRNGRRQRRLLGRT